VFNSFFEQSGLVGIVCWEWQPPQVEAQALKTGPFAESCLPEKANLIRSIIGSRVRGRKTLGWKVRTGLEQRTRSCNLAYHCLPRQRLLLHSMKNLCAVHSEDCSVHSNSHQLKANHF
jgi:hypothetical protein